MNIFVGSLSFSVKDDELKAVFEQYGEVSSARVLTDKFTGRSKGFGFVEMPDDGEAQQAIEDLNGKDVKGRNITVNQSIERKEGEHRNNRRDNFRRNNNYRNNE